MPDSEHALLKEAFQHAENCLTEANAIVDHLDQAIVDLQEEELELREAVTQSLLKADQFIDHCGEIVHDLLELRLKSGPHTLRLVYLLKLKPSQKHSPALNFDGELAGVHRNSAHLACSGLFKSPRKGKRESFLVRMGQIQSPESEE